MKKSEFNWIAPRYLDGEASETERRAVETALLSQRSAQQAFEVLERESGWIGKSFRRSPEDISRIVIRVRRRNPHRKLYISPILAVALQVLLIVGLVWQMSRLATSFAPPQVTLTEVEQGLSIDDTYFAVGELDDEKTLINTEEHSLADLEDAQGSPAERAGAASSKREVIYPARSLSMGQKIATAQEGQIKLRVGIADEVNVNHDTSLSFARPDQGEQHIVRLEQGELWARMIDSMKRFRFELSEFPDVEISGNRAEINLVSGISRTKTLLPRGFVSPSGRMERAPSAILRVFDGAVELSNQHGTQRVAAGGVRVIFKDGTISEQVDDPDADHYRVLRRRESRFRQGWHWFQDTRYPLARTQANYQLWKELMAVVAEIRGHAEALQQDNQQESVEDFKRLVLALNEIEPDGFSEQPDLGVEDYRKLRSEVLKGFVAAKYSVASKGLPANPNVAYVLSEVLHPLMEAWQLGDVDWKPAFSDEDYVVLFTTLEIQTLVAELGRFADDLWTRYDNASTAISQVQAMMDGSTSVDRASQSLKALEEAVVAARVALEEALNNPLHDPEGDQLLEVERRLDALEAERAKLVEKKQQIDRLRTELADPQDRYNQLERERSPQRRTVDELTSQINALKQAVGSNTFVQSDLEQALLDEAEAEAAEQGARVYRDGLSDQVAKKFEALNALKEEKKSLNEQIKRTLTEKSSRQNEVVTLLTQLSLKRLSVAKLKQKVREARAEFWRLAPDMREGSSEAAALEAAEGALSAAEQAVEKLQGEYVSASDKLKDAELRRADLTEQEQTINVDDGQEEYDAIQEVFQRAESELEKLVAAHTAAEGEVTRLEALKQKLADDHAALQELEASLPAEQATLDALNQQMDALKQAMDPKKEKLRVLLEDLQREEPALNERLEKAENERELIIGVQKNIDSLRVDLMDKQTRLLDALRISLDEHAKIAASMTRMPRKLPEFVDQMEIQRDQALLASADGTITERESLEYMHEALRIGDELATALKEELARVVKQNIATRDLLHVQYLAHQWMREQAGVIEERVLDRSDVAVATFREYLRLRVGFPEPVGASEEAEGDTASADAGAGGDGSESEGAGDASVSGTSLVDPGAIPQSALVEPSVYAILSRYMRTAGKDDLEQLEDAKSLAEPEKFKREFLQAMWNLFASFEVESMRQERERLKTFGMVPPAESKLSYLVALNSFNRSQDEQGVQYAWVGTANTLVEKYFQKHDE